MNRSWHRRPVLSLALMVVLAPTGCSSESPAGPAATPASPSATETQDSPPPAPESFSVRAFVDIKADPVSEESLRQ